MKKINWLLALALSAWSVVPMTAGEGSATIYVAPDNGFEVNLAAAMQKKDVPAQVVMSQADAKYILQPTPVSVNKESGMSKFVRCEFAFCVGIEDSGDVSVQFIDRATNRVVWAYEVAKQRSFKNRQSMAEAIAKHLRKDFFQQGW